MKRYGIKITYSWGDEESPLNYNTYDTPEEAYQEICRLAGKEAYVYNEEAIAERTCSVTFNASMHCAKLYYDHDHSYCYYKVVDLQSPYIYTTLTLARARELLNNVVNRAAVGQNLKTQLEELLKCGFTPEELVYEFNFDKLNVESLLGTVVKDQA